MVDASRFDTVAVFSRIFVFTVIKVGFKREKYYFLK